MLTNSQKIDTTLFKMCAALSKSSCSYLISLVDIRQTLTSSLTEQRKILGFAQIAVHHVNCCVEIYFMAAQSNCAHGGILSLSVIDGYKILLAMPRVNIY